MNAIQWEQIDGRDFWKLADKLQEQTVAHAHDLFAFAEHADRQTLLQLLVQYRFFTIYYIPDLAILVSRMQDSALRSFLAGVLADELGNGDPSLAHPRLYDDFLRSIGSADLDLDACALASNIELLENARRQLIDPNRSTRYGVGLRGMGGECVCQIYLSRFYEHIIRNPWIKANHDSIDWRFWNMHVGDHDIEHRARTRELIDAEIVVHGTGEFAELGRGYYDSMMSWGSFWATIFDSVKAAGAQRVRVNQGVDFHALISACKPGSRGARPAAEQFHLAIPVRDLDEARRFYAEVMGATEGRSTANFVDFNFYGHHLVLHAAPRDRPRVFDTFRSAFHGEEVQIPHFGMNLDRESWHELAERIKASNYDFFDPPHIRMEGLPGEHATLFVVDPSGNAMEFKAFRNHHEVFARVFDPLTRELDGLHHLAADAAARPNAN